MILKGRFGEGEAQGIAWYFKPSQSLPTVKHHAPEAAEKEFQKLLAKLRKQLELEKRTLGRGEEFLQFPLAILQDPELLQSVRKLLQKRVPLPNAISQSFIEWEEKLKALDDPYLRLRGDDLADLRQRILSLITVTRPTKYPQQNFIVCAKDLYVTDLLEWRRFPLSGICLEEGNEAAHGVMLARSLGIPIVGGVSELLKRCKEGDDVAIVEKRVLINEHKTISSHKNHRTNLAGKFMTKNGTLVILRANIQLHEEIAKAKEVGAMGVGLFRTEYQWIPHELPLQEQTAIYREAIETFSPHPVIFRLADLGSDKPYRRTSWPSESNPALGWRGIRFLLDNRTILTKQLNTLFQAAKGNTLHLLLPMVSTPEEIQEFIKFMAPIKRKHHGNCKLGIMLETPASAYLVKNLPQEIAFVSLGTNDLLQYFFAIDRVHPTLKANPLHPLFLAYLEEIVTTLTAAGKSVSLCGELAGNPKALPLLLKLGLREFSVSAVKIPELARRLSQLSL